MPHGITQYEFTHITAEIAMQSLESNGLKQFLFWDPCIS